ncbi:oligoendopeptidase, partial [Paenibacillus validus]|nr:oligoendopeptidase [Paenibacillus validus]
MQSPLPQTWDLERFFAGGSQSEAFARFLRQLETNIAALRTALKELRVPNTAEEATALLPTLALLQ